MCNIEEKINLIQKTKRNEIIELILKEDTTKFSNEKWCDILEKAAKVSNMNVNDLLAEIYDRTDFELWENDEFNDIATNTIEEETSDFIRLCSRIT